MIVRAESEWTKGEARHLLNRAGFGGTPGDVDEFHAMGREGAVDFLLEGGRDAEVSGEGMPGWAETEVMREEMAEELRMRRELREESEGLSAKAAAEARRKFQRRINRRNRGRQNEAVAWWFGRMVGGRVPLREKMTLFWHDHFATSLRKVRRPSLMLGQNRLFREHAVENFRELTERIVRDPAMMIYLDVQRSSKAKPNENFAREVMELFTLGEGHYTEEDVRNAARALTGYRLNRVTGQVVQSERAWDDGEKVIFGERGRFNGTDVVKLIFRKDRCADFLAGKLWEYFAYEDAEEGLVKGLGRVLRAADYELKPVLKGIFLSKQFYSERAMGGQIKSPVQYLAQMLRELEIEDFPVGFAVAGQRQLGQVLFEPPNVAGWDWGKAWINTNTLLARYNLAGALTKGSFEEGGGRGRMRRMSRRLGMGRGGGSFEGADFADLVGRGESGESGESRDAGRMVDGLIERFFCIPVPEKARRSFIEYAETKRAGGFTEKELGELCHLMMSTPYYQVC